MPKLIDYSARFEQIREAAFAVVLADGVPALTLPRIAADLQTSVSTLRRTMASASSLPRMAHQWVDRRERMYSRRSMPGELVDPADWARALNALVRGLPFDQGRADDARVEADVLAYSRVEPWAVEVNATLAAHRERLLPLVFADLELSTDATHRRTVDLHALLIGTTQAVIAGVLPTDRIVPLVQDYVLELRAVRPRDGRRDAA